MTGNLLLNNECKYLELPRYSDEELTISKIPDITFPSLNIEKNVIDHIVKTNEGKKYEVRHYFINTKEIVNRSKTRRISLLIFKEKQSKKNRKEQN